jgi:hypothetical protein
LTKDNSRTPTKQEILQLTAFLTKLCDPEFHCIREWGLGQPDKDGVRHFPFPEYKPIVEEFFHIASQEQWSDYNYKPEEATQMLQEENFIEQSSLSEIKTMLTYCVRGERFCDGHWGTMIGDGYICRILRRLSLLSDKI